MDDILKRLGIYRALNASAVQYNSIVFRVIVGFMAGIPTEIIALIPAIEFIMNFFLEIPAGYLADRYGRVPFALVGHVAVILGLSCGYLGLLGIFSEEVSYSLFVLQGFFIGFTRPLISGSVEAFYQDALKKNEGESLGSRDSDKSFTLSKIYGRYFTTFALVAAFGFIYLFSMVGSVEHAFLPGIFLWLVTLNKLSRDYSKLGDDKQPVANVSTNLKRLWNNRRALNSVIYATSSFMVLGVVMAYLVVALGRDKIFAADPFFLWAYIACFFMGSQGLGWVAKSYILPYFIDRLSEKAYLAYCYLALLLSSLAMSYGFFTVNNWALSILIFFYGMFFFTSFSGIQAVSQNMLLGEIKGGDSALNLSLQNMPGLLFIGGYSAYLFFFRSGCPSIFEIFATVTGVSGCFLALHFIVYRPSERPV